MSDNDLFSTARFWRDDIDSLAFRPLGHEGLCVVHRLAFRTLMDRDATPAECLHHFDAHAESFEEAAAGKAVRRGLPVDANFHLNSRDVRRHGVTSSPA